MAVTGSDWQCLAVIVGGGDGIGRGGGRARVVDGTGRPIRTTVAVRICGRVWDPFEMVASIELLQQSTFVVFLGLLISFTTVYFSCESASRCVKAGDCTRLSLESSKYIPQCNFVRTPGTLGALEYSDPTAFPNQTAETSNTVLRA